MTNAATLVAGGLIGTTAGANSDGVLVGSLARSAVAFGLLESQTRAATVITKDDLLFVDESAAAADATADDVEIVGATLAADDAIYFGNATEFDSIDITITTQGDYTDPVWAFEYWDGSAYVAVADLVDGTTAFEAAAGIVNVAFTRPTDWAANTVIDIERFYIRASVTSVTATTTPCQIGEVVIVGTVDGESVFTDYTTEINEATAGDVDLLPSSNHQVGDAFYFGMAEKFPLLELLTSQAMVATATILWEYWDGTAWDVISGVSTINDESAQYATAAGTLFTRFAPPADWAANTAANGPDGNAGWFIRARMSAFTSMTTLPLATQAWAYPLVTGAVGMAGSPGRIRKVTTDCATLSGANADSVFLIASTESGSSDEFTWTQATKSVSADVVMGSGTGEGLVIVQLEEDGTTEFGDAVFYASR